MWEHWSDLLLATQLAGLREGYTTVSKVWDARQSHKLAICCHADKTDGRKEACQKRLVHAEAEAPINSETKWKVVRVRSENLSRSQHTRHVGGIGVSDGFKVSAAFTIVRFCLISAPIAGCVVECPLDLPGQSRYRLERNASS